MEGQEMGGHAEGEARPAVMLSLPKMGRAQMRVIVPLTGFFDDQLNLHWLTPIAPDKENGLSKMSCADTSQIRAISTSRFEDKRGHIGELELKAILKSLGIVLGFQIQTEETEKSA